MNRLVSGVASSSGSWGTVGNGTGFGLVYSINLALLRQTGKAQIGRGGNTPATTRTRIKLTNNSCYLTGI